MNQLGSFCFQVIENTTFTRKTDMIDEGERLRRREGENLNLLAYKHGPFQSLTRFMRNLMLDSSNVIQNWFL